MSSEEEAVQEEQVTPQQVAARLRFNWMMQRAKRIYYTQPERSMHAWIRAVIEAKRGFEPNEPETEEEETEPQ